jgi:uncharacterized protein (DUF362 family)
MNHKCLSRREFVGRSLALAAATPFASALLPNVLAETTPSASKKSDSRVAIVRCRSYGTEADKRLDEALKLLGGIGWLVKNKTVTVKLNLTGTDFTPFLNRPVGETYMTHFDTALALTRILFREGAKRVRFVESTQSKATLETTVGFADWDVKALRSYGKVDFENTRNLGTGSRYSHLKVPTGGLMFSSLDLNQAYEDTDVMVSLAKLKNHATTGVTLTMKNMFGITPNSLYGSKAGSEDATEGRMPLHNITGFEKLQLPGMKSGPMPVDSTSRVPRIIVDVCAARPIHLAIIDGITSMKGAEGPWCGGEEKLKFVNPGVLIAGFNPVATDAVGTAVMGYDNPRAVKPVRPFDFCENHLLLAEQAGLGTADLKQIDLRGLPLKDALYSYG